MEAGHRKLPLVFQNHRQGRRRLLLVTIRASGIVWDPLLNLRIVYSRRAIKEPMLQIGHKTTEPLWQDTSSSIGFCVSDNCDYFPRT